MKKIFVAALAASVFATPAYAQSSTAADSFTISANVQNECSIDDPNNVTLDVSINEDSGPNALKINASNNTLQNIWVSCNYNASLTVEAPELVNAAGASLAANDPNDFTNKIAYSIKLEPNAGDTGSPFPAVSLTTKNGPVTKTQQAVGAFHDNARLNVNLPAGDQTKRPVAGDYTAVATITLGAS